MKRSKKRNGDELVLFQLVRLVSRHPPLPSWFHKLGNILDKLPKRLQPRVKVALHEVMYAETRAHAREAITRFAAEDGAKYARKNAIMSAVLLYWSDSMRTSATTSRNAPTGTSKLP